MKTISLVFAFLMMLIFGGVASAATLSWGVIPNPTPDQSVHVTLDNNSTIAATYGNGTYTGGFTHDWNFTAVPSSTVVIGYMNALIARNFTFSTITLDGNNMAYNALENYYTASSTFNGPHVIHIVGAVSAMGQEYSIQVQSAVPVPGALLLFGPAIAGLMCFARRKTVLTA